MPSFFKVYCNVDFKRWGRKPDASIVQNRLKQAPASIEFRELIDTLCNGGNCRASAVNGGKDEDFISAQMIFIDVDNGRKKNGVFIPAEKPISIEDARTAVEQSGFKVNAIYTTWSDMGPDAPFRKFRMVLLLDKQIVSAEQFKASVTLLLGTLPKECVDYGTRNPARIFYGSGCGTPVYYNVDAVNSTDDILAKSADIVKKVPKAPKTRSGKKTASRGNEPNRKVVNAIREHNADYLKRRLGRSKTTFDTQKELYDYIYRLPLDELLEVDSGKSFSCILPEHDDINPSANVYQTPYGIWKYKCRSDCLGNGTALNIKQLVELLGNYTSEYQAISFICTIYNLKVLKTAWSEEQNFNIDKILSCIMSVNGEEAFRTLCPTAEKVTRNAMLTYVGVLSQAKETLYPEKTGNGNVIFYLSVRRLATAVGKKSIAQVQGYLKQLCYCHMLEILPDEEVPISMLKRARAEQHDGQKRTSFYSIPSWVLQQTQLIEQSGRRWQDNGYRVRGISYEMFYRNEPSEAMRLYPDSKTRVLASGETVTRTTTKEADKRHMEIALFVLDELQKNGYCTEKKIINFAKNKSLTKIQIARSMSDICNTYNLKKCRCNKDLKAFYHIGGKGYPVIIVRD